MGARDVDVVLNVHKPGYEEDIEETALRRLLRLQSRCTAGLLDGKLTVIGEIGAQSFTLR